MEIFIRRMPHWWDLILENSAVVIRLKVRWVEKVFSIELEDAPCGQMEMDHHRIDIQLKGASEVVYAENISLIEHNLRDAGNGSIVWKFNGNAIMAPNLVLTCRRDDEPLFELGTEISFRRHFSLEFIKRALKGYSLSGVYYSCEIDKVRENLPALLYGIKYGSYGRPPPG